MGSPVVLKALSVWESSEKADAVIERLGGIKINMNNVERLESTIQEWGRLDLMPKITRMVY